jgi:hypothetical protein
MRTRLAEDKNPFKRDRCAVEDGDGEKDREYETPRMGQNTDRPFHWSDSEWNGRLLEQRLQYEEKTL